MFLLCILTCALLTEIVQSLLDVDDVNTLRSLVEVLLMFAVSGFKTVSSHFAPLRLHFAINACRLVDVKQLILDDIDLNFAAPTNGQTPLTLSILSQQYDIASILIAAGADVSVAESTAWRRQPIHLAAAAGCVNLVESILSKSAVLVNTTDAMLFTALHHAAIAGNSDVIAVLLAAGARIEARDDRGRTAFFRAIEHANIDAVDILSKANASANTVDVFGWTPIYHVALFGQLNLVEYLLNKGGALVDGYGILTPLHAACTSLATEHTVGVLRYTGVDYYMRRCRATTPLMHLAVTRTLLSADHDDSQLVHVLLDHGANVNIRDNYGATALQLAAQSGRSQIIRLLISAGADVTAEEWIVERRWPDAIVEDVEVCSWLEHLSRTRVKRLISICRLTIRNLMLPPIHCTITRLPLPLQLQRFLQL